MGNSSFSNFLSWEVGIYSFVQFDSWSEEPEFFFFFPFRAAPPAFGSSQARGQIRATATGLHHSHSNSGSELYLRPIPQLRAVPDP